MAPELKTSEDLEREIERLKKVNESLMDRIERGMGSGSSSFSLFEKNVYLASEVKERTLELEKLTSEIESEKNKLAGIIQALPGDILIFDKDFIVNKSFNSFLVKKFNTKQGLALKQFLGEEFFNLVKSKVNRFDATSRVVFFDHLSGSEENYSYYTCSISSQNKNHYVLYIQDNTEKYLQDQRLKDQEAKILQASKLASLGEMAGGIAHEINNPLTIVNLAASSLKKMLIKNGVSVPGINQNVDIIEKTIQRISKIITGMKILSRESKEFRKESVSFKEIISDVMGLCTEKFKNNGVELRLRASGHEMDSKIYCDRLLISQILINLLNNAYDATEGQNERWVEIGFSSGEIDIITIKDSGHGIPQHVKAKIFNPFFTTKEIGKGTGLGLSISKSIMENHGGTIELDNDSENTCFVLKLPGAKTEYKVG